MFLSVVLFTPNCLCVSVRGLVLSVFLSVEQFTPNSVFFCQSYISRITVCFCPWYGSRITLCVFLSMVQFSVFFFFFFFFVLRTVFQLQGTAPDWLKACQAFGILGMLAMAASLACALSIFFMNEQKIFSLLAPVAAAVGGQYR